MVKTFIVISIVVHIVTLLLIYFIYKRFQSLHELNLPEIKELLNQTLLTIKEENEWLHRNITDVKPTTVTKDRELDEEQKELRNVLKQTERTSVLKNVTHKNTTDQSLLKTTVEDKYEPSLQGQILQLHEKGLNNVEIAQTLNCGKT